MATYTVGIYSYNPAGNFSTGINSTFVYNGPSTRTGTATIRDPEAGIEGYTLDDDNAGGETARADVTINGQTSLDVSVDAEITWTLRDTVTGEEFQVSQLDVEGGNAGGMYTLSELPLIQGRTYQVLFYDSNPDVLSGDAAFDIRDYEEEVEVVEGSSSDDTMTLGYTDAGGDSITTDGDEIYGGAGNDTIDGDAGDDTILGGGGSDSIEGGDGNDAIYGGDNGTRAVQSEYLNWAAQGADGQDVSGGFTQTTGDMDVFVSFNNAGSNNNPTYQLETTDTMYVAGGEPYNPNSSLFLFGNGDGLTSTARLDFMAAEGTLAPDEVQNVRFRINDVDWGNANHTDEIVITAVDANGQPVSIVLTPGGGETITGDAASGYTITANAVADNFNEVGGSVLVEIAGPVSQIDITYSNLQGGTQGIWLTDVHFDTIVETDDADTLSGGAGDDTLVGDTGADSLDGGTGNDSLQGDAGDDTLSGGAGADTMGGGGGMDYLDYSNSDAAVDVNLAANTATGGHATGDVLAGGLDGIYGSAYNDTLTGYDGQGPDYTNVFYGNGGDDLLDGAGGGDSLYGGDGSDTVLGGTGDDLVEGGTGADSLEGNAGADTIAGDAGDDTIIGGTGNDSLTGGDDQDQFLIDDADGTDTITGGEGGTDVDTLDLEATSSGAGATVIFSGDEAGDYTYTSGTATGSFTEIEAIDTTDFDDTVDASASSVAQSVSSGAGDDLLTGGSGDDTLMYGEGADTIYGGAGNDSIDDAQGANATTGGNLIYAGDGDDTVYGSAGADTLDGGTGNDNLSGEDGDDSIVAGGGADTLGGGSGQDTLVLNDGFDGTYASGGEAGSDFDTLDLSQLTGPVTITYTGDEAGTVTDGTNTMTFDGIEYIIATDGADVVDATADGAGILLDAGAGDDTITGGTGDDIILAGDDADRINLIDNGGNDTIAGGEGGTDQDSISASSLTGPVDITYSGDEAGQIVSGADTITFLQVEEFELTAQDDTLDATADTLGVAVEAGAGDDSVLGGSGNDTVFGYEGSDYVDGGDGDDVINTRTSVGTGLPDRDYSALGFPSDGDPTNDLDTVYGGAGNDTILTGDDNDYVEGGTGNDSIDAGFDDDTVLGGDGADWISGNEGADSVDGGTGNDTIYGDDATGTYSALDIPDDTDFDTTNQSDTLRGGEGDDVIYGMDDADSLYGDSGNDTLDGGIDDDLLDGGAGNDSLIGGGGDDRIYMGSGNDTVDAGDGDDTVYASIGNDYIDGGAGNDSLVGGGYAYESDTILGGSGNDTLDGIAGNDSHDGGTGDDSVIGGLGNDTLIGGDGNDTLDGGEGADEFYGGLGDDEMYLAEGDSAYGGDGDDLFVLSDLGEAGASTIYIEGGETGETGGDTLRLTSDISKADITFTNTDDAAGGLGGFFTMADGTVVTFNEIENIICFTPGTRILTDTGERAIETLKEGDLVMTRDNGLQPIRWIDHSTVPGMGDLAPVAINSTVLPGAKRPLLVSPQHRVLFEGAQPEMLFGEPEVFAAAKHLENGSDIRRMPRPLVTYFHLALDRHEVIYAEGAATESFHPGQQGLETLSTEAKDRLYAAFPEMADDPESYGPTARPCLKAHEARLLAPANGRGTPHSCARRVA